MSTLVVNSTDSELETLTHSTTDNGSFSIRDQELSELWLTEARPSQEDRAMDSETPTLLLLDNTKTKVTKRSVSTMDQGRTSETPTDNALMFTVTLTPTTDTFIGTLATMVSTKPGSLTPREPSSHNTHLKTDSNSRSSQE